MNKKAISIVFMVIIFGLPVSWYLFLQFFGENKFDLPLIEKWTSECDPELKSVVVINKGSVVQHPNEMSIITEKLNNQSILTLHLVDADTCNLDSDIYLIDQSGQVRGKYEMNREEVDRFEAEVDIYILNTTNGTSIKGQ